MCKVTDYSPNFTFTRLCCPKIPVARPARPANVISDLLDSSLQSAHFDAHNASKLTAAWEAIFGELLSNEILGENPSTAPNAFSDEERDWCEHWCGRGLRRARAPQPSIYAHLLVESSGRKLLLVVLPPPHFHVGGRNHTNARMQTCHHSFAFEIKESFGLLALRLISFLLTRFHFCFQDCDARKLCWWLSCHPISMSAATT